MPLTQTPLGAEYTDSLGGIGVNVFNSLDPPSQTFGIDANLFNDGLCLESVRLSFASKPEDTGGVVTSKSDPWTIMAHLEETLSFRSQRKHSLRAKRQTDGLTDFVFESPVYLDRERMLSLC